MHELGPEFPPSWRGRPPAMLDPDVPVWHAYLDAHASEFARIWYNVRITSVDLVAKYPDPELRSIAQALLPLRIDAVGDRTTEIWTIEVAGVAGLRSIAQALTYAALWRREHPTERRPVVPVLVCGLCPEDVQAGADAAAVRVIHVGR